MGFILNITEETFGSDGTVTVPLRIDAEQMTLADLIMSKVAAQIQLKLKARKPPTQDRTPFNNLKENILSGAHIKARKRRAFAVNTPNALPDPEQAGYSALAAFRKNMFFVVVDGKQREDLDEALTFTAESEVHFVRLMPLIGG